MDKYIQQSITLNSSSEPTLPWIMDDNYYVYSAFPLVMKLNVIDTPLFKSAIFFDGESYAESEFRVNPAEPLVRQLRIAILVCEDVLHRICDIQTWNNEHLTFLARCYSKEPTIEQLKKYHDAVHKLREEVMCFYDEHIDEQEDDHDATE